ncbi:MAG TPA: tetratricopeptide repeat protein, partial [Rhizomicrobium sp.]|nr:tetratricopeptide repeat protein [Rhizomicrobium sp.]
RSVLQMQPNAVPALNYLSLLLNMRGELTEAETLIRKAIALLPREATLHNNLGNILHKKKDIEGAAAAYREALERNASYPEAYYNLGLMQSELGRGDEALAAQRRAVAIKPDYAEALTQIGSLLSDRQEFNEALTALDKAVAANPQHFGGHYYRGTVLINLQRHAEATQSLRKAVALRPQSFEAHYALGNALNYTNQEAAALDAYRIAIDLNPEYLNAHYDFSSLAWTMGRQDLALTSYVHARQKVGEKPDLLLAEGEMRLRLDRPEEGRVLLEKAHSLSPERADIANALARSLVTLGRFDEAVPTFERAAEIEPANIGHRTEQAIALLHARRPAEAQRIIEIARQINPTNQLGLGLATLAQRETGDRQFAELFDPTRFVKVYDLPPPRGYADIASFNADLAGELASLHTRRMAPFDQTLRGGTQTMGQLFAKDLPHLAQFKERLFEIIEDYIRNLPPDPAHPFLSRKEDAFSVAGSWSCRLRSQGFHTNHIHPDGWISSAYYVSLPKSMRQAERDQAGWIKFGESNLNLGGLDRPHHFEQPAVGRLVLFPSYFWHGTVPFIDDDVRLTIAFDVVPGSGTNRAYRNY